MRLLLSSLLLSLLLWQASAQSGAPFDTISGCVASRPDDYEDNWIVLLDIRNYQNLFGTFGVWKERDLDVTGSGVSSTYMGCITQAS